MSNGDFQHFGTHSSEFDEHKFFYFALVDSFVYRNSRTSEVFRIVVLLDESAASETAKTITNSAEEVVAEVLASMSGHPERKGEKIPVRIFYFDSDKAFDELLNDGTKFIGFGDGNQIGEIMGNGIGDSAGIIMTFFNNINNIYIREQHKTMHQTFCETIRMNGIVPPDKSLEGGKFILQIHFRSFSHCVLRAGQMDITKPNHWEFSETVVWSGLQQMAIAQSSQTGLLETFGKFRELVDMLVQKVIETKRQKENLN